MALLSHQPAVESAQPPLPLPRPWKEEGSTLAQDNAAFYHRYQRGLKGFLRTGLKMASLAIVTSLIVVLAWFYFQSKDKDSSSSESSEEIDDSSLFLSSRNSIPHGIGHCPSTQQALLPDLPAPVNVWAPFTPQEASDVGTWLRAEERGLNLTEATRSTPSDNVIFDIQLYIPPKDAVLAYLDDPQTVHPPSRFAHVAINQGAAPNPTVGNFLVGPLPISEATEIRPLTEIYHNYEVPFNARALVDLEMAEERDYFIKAAAPLAEAVKDLFGGELLGDSNDTLLVGPSGPKSYDGSWRKAWYTWRWDVPGSFLHPINFYTYFDMSGTDTSQWQVVKVVYHDQFFPSVESFLEAWRNGTFIRHPPPEGTRESRLWSSRQRQGEPRDLDHLPGPTQVSFAGPRFRVDPATRYVTWMGWSMYLGFSRDMGLSLWDIGFKGERLIYELSPQEAVGHYSGGDPFQSRTAWLDRHFSMGARSRELIPGYDCPRGAVYLPMDTYVATGNVHIERAICVFEHDLSIPLTTHIGPVEGESGAVNSYVLVLRSIPTVGKVDFDVAGTANSLLKTTVGQEEVELPWMDEDWGNTMMQGKIIREYVEVEDDSRSDYPPNGLGNYAIVNKDALNAWGNPRGYAIRPGQSPTRLNVVGSKLLEKNANWAKHNIAVTKRKETEPSSSSIWNGQLPGAPPVDFDKFFDGESIEQEDLVLWINLGAHHLVGAILGSAMFADVEVVLFHQKPHAEDSPNTKTNVASSSFMLTPMNYFDFDVSMESLNSVTLKDPAKVGGPFEDNGVKGDWYCNVQPLPLPAGASSEHEKGERKFDHAKLNAMRGS
ncbi:copper amine oxidase [Coprinopsis cinerea okayama7|uniref:Amine oxidase n=1 Tax=Coprinopsis cinerea (strain Okayama-7 / 130 / ATCC MYA-4618 / FGSC 9003) TaxID=240176 RepID=A8P6S8_COPC7|nr:copper amine oxidase [Coprinopsis cinerea okayama7\|eukprot:XP_001839220.2 copper amine oxidase [Coprinopsis cinerea okayama7\